MLAFVLLGLIAIPLIWSAVSPRTLWSVVGRPHKNPAAVEPSAASFMVWRIGAVIMLGALVWMVWALLTI